MHSFRDQPPVIAYYSLLPFNGLFSMATCESRYQKGRTILDFTEVRDDGEAVASAEPYAKHLHFVPVR